MIFKTAKSKLKHYNIPPTDENHELLHKAKAAIAASNPDQALKLLSTLKLKTLDIEITALRARLADLERTQRFGTESFDTETREYNKIKKSIILLITALEQEIAQSFEFYDKIRAALKTRYETRLSQKLSNRQPVNLRLVPSNAGTTPQAANTFVQYSEGQIRGKLAEYYKDANGRLLLVGVPGAGKTTLLLQLELELLEQETTRIPVILNLARWSSEFQTLEAWIQEILPSEMGLIINKRIAADLIAQNRLIVLLDGLDEIKEDNRQICLEAIGIYGENPDRHFIISSRIEEYKAAAKDAPVNSQVEVGILKYGQLIEQLDKTEQNEGSKRLLAALKEDLLLREIAEVPFYFNTLQLLFARGKYLHEFNFSTLNIEGREKEIKQCFVSEMFRKFTSKDYDAQLIHKYLCFFSSRLKSKNLVEFELINLQYTWCNLSKKEKLSILFMEGLVRGLKVGLIFGISVGIIEVIIRGAIFSIVFGMLETFFGETVLESLNFFAINLLIFVVILLVGVPSVVLLCGALGIILGKKIQNFIIYTNDNFAWRWAYLSFRIFGFPIIWLTGWLIMALATNLITEGLSIGLAGMLTFGFQNIINHPYMSFLQVNTPNQRFISSAKVFHFSIIQHWHFRHILSRKGLLPFRLVPFLNDMVACNILETTGASWRFRHRILQDYFTDQWVETEFEPEQK